MNKIKVGIMTCSNTTRILDCSLGACLTDLYARRGAFERYRNQSIELAGITSCSGCPTVAGHATILPKVESLVRCGASRIHLTYCMVVLCPFVRKYLEVARDAFPAVDFIRGTHEPHQANDDFRCDIGEKLGERRKTIIP